ncbi:hypothetical protein BO70DRAFT_370063 [Aspergillus heteromorphus CBS 117.55]|uniref:Rhodopsin domain-containing protein n=1 Tax=Aspergillus heteromorphus CBS 117.55 TaxID=1448321 RepID=A0A317WJV5_9EURO|nr:uncharacterized protein BO70DRAFT_370063 [Aspergillus heteromorphus CBS 117.55]PWY85951.1 hypothetical protein BO70DRAFT_370063 [Aspergillus heteromorphus CBS 117.55]
MAIIVRTVVLVLAIPTTMVCCLRLYVRKFILRSFGLDDWMVVFALIMVNGFSALGYTITYYGLGQRTRYVSESHLVIWLKIYYAAQCSYLIVAFAVKASLTIFVMRLFPTPRIEAIGRCMLGFLAAFTLSGTLALAFQCRPFRAVYDKSITDSQCYTVESSFAILILQGVIMFVMDVVILTLPVRCIWNLNMPLRQRILVLGLLLLGFAACIAALVRFSTLTYATDETDYTYSAAKSLVWMVIEFNLGLMTGSLPSLRTFVQLRTSAHRSSLATTGSTNLEFGKVGWGKGIKKETQITRVFETIDDDGSDDQGRIAPLYGPERFTTTAHAFSDMGTAQAESHTLSKGRGVF